ncbi:MAG: tyrosine--tRNA ligase [Verrucomicrobia bacterium]|nr:MAG: tyrosine--tRNA ligase [Verrucomicrobiota bacterium]PYK49511.1 MAG: tyrosine--tRNA ligase [Verrucomicrobiota bacterium]
MQPEEALAFLKQGAAQIISEGELRDKLALGRPLRVKLGVDPTTSDIHLGHTVVLRKLRQFQDLGHQAILIIGDFTGMIGDPSGRSVTRPHLTHQEVIANAATYREQAFKILDPARTETVCNGDWFRAMSFENVIRLNSRVTLQQMLQREDFKARIDKQQSIRAHEIQYPIMQGWDSVMVRADVELGGTDQLFNILVGRDFQREEGLPQQVVFLVPILEGLDGSKKMSKSLGNFVAVNESASDMFGKLMSISDELMARYYELLLGRVVPAGMPPLEAKKQFAFEIVQIYHSPAVAKKTLDEWDTRFSKRDLEHADLPAFSPTEREGLAAVNLVSNAYREVFNLQKSHSEVSRLIKQGSVELNGSKIQDPKATITLKPGQILRLDRKHAVRIQ